MCGPPIIVLRPYDFAFFTSSIHSGNYVDIAETPTISHSEGLYSIFSRRPSKIKTSCPFFFKADARYPNPKQGATIDELYIGLISKTFNLEFNC